MKSSLKFLKSEKVYLEKGQINSQEDVKQLGRELQSNSLTTRLELHNACIPAWLGDAMGTALGDALQVNTHLKELSIYGMIVNERTDAEQGMDWDRREGRR